MSLLISRMMAIIKNNGYYFLPYIFLFIIGMPFLLIYEKGDILIWLNSHHNKLFDYIFYYGTWLGDGWFIAILLIPLALIKVRYAITILIIFLVTGGIVQILKYAYGLPRPTAFFPADLNLYMIEGFNFSKINSFPSGHTTTAFALFLYLNYLIRIKWLGPVFILLALIVAISRIYLLQHFYIDVYFGSLIGVIMTLFILVALENQKNLNSMSWYNNTLFNVFKKDQPLK